MFIIKICGITNEEDARVAVDAGANALGFNFYTQSPRYVTPERASEIAKNVQGTFLKVGVFVNSVGKLADEIALDVLQLHGNCPNYPHRRVWRAIRAGERPDDPEVEAYLMDTPAESFGGSGKTFDWKLAGDSPFRVIVAGGLDATNVAEAIRTAQPWGVDACSRLESSPGRKDPQRVRDFVAAALSASRNLQEVTV